MRGYGRTTGNKCSKGVALVAPGAGLPSVLDCKDPM